ncbi:MAG: acylphosphatase [Candidatus Micrarchaeota archaeon]|nr:acylphosphatase [Candidatus Micrarchaeota archaeon]
MGTKARLAVSGEVQGVGYRWFVLRTAQLLGISGTVRNAPDGTVEILCEAQDKKRLDEFVERIRRRDELGPRVDGVRVEQYAGPVGKGFEIVF